MKQYVYKDKSQPNKPVIFACYADGILQADEMYKQTTGMDVTKQPLIGCEVEAVRTARLVIRGSGGIGRRNGLKHRRP